MEFNSDDLGALLQKLHKLPVQVRIAMAAGLGVLVVALSAYFFWYPSLEQAIALDARIQSTLASLKTKSAVLSKREQIQKDLVAMQTLLPRLQGALPAGRELPVLLGQINDSIVKNSLVLSSFVPGKPQDSEVLTLIPIDLTVMGDGEKIAKLPNLMAMLPRPVSLNKFQLTYIQDKKVWSLAGQITAFAQLGARIESNPVTPELTSTGAKP
jgi:Tfp pilus assembly protein PilO